VTGEEIDAETLGVLLLTAQSAVLPHLVVRQKKKRSLWYAN